MVFGMLLWIVGAICAVWVIADVLRHQKKMSDTHKVLWIIFAVFFSILTAVVYYILVKKR